MTFKPDISIIVVGSRWQNWLNLYKSVLSSTKRTFEIVFGGPIPLPPELMNFINVKYIRDVGCPSRVMNMCAEIAEGKLVTWTSDNGFYLPNALDLAIDCFYKSKQKKNVTVCKHTDSTHMDPDEYYKISYHTDEMDILKVSEDFYLLNKPIMLNKYFKEFGGMNCDFETIPIAAVDFSIRCQTLGAKTNFFNLVPIFMHNQQQSSNEDICTQHAVVEYDEPLFRHIYKDKEIIEANLNIKLDNWKESPNVWERRRLYPNEKS